MTDSHSPASSCRSSTRTGRDQHHAAGALALARGKQIDRQTDNTLLLYVYRSIDMLIAITG